jgi:WD40 repeat protein
MRSLLLAVFICTTATAFTQTPELIVPAGHGDQVYLTKFSADGKFLFSVGTGAKAVKIWDTKSGRLLKNLAVDNFPTCMQTGNDGKVLIIGTKKEVYFYAFPSFKLLYKTAHGVTDAVARDNNLYLLYSENINGYKIAAIDIATFREKILYDDANGNAEIISLSPRGDKLFFASGFNVKILDIASTTVTNTNSPDAGSIFMGFMPTGNLFSFTDKGKNKSVPGINDGSSFKAVRSFDFKVPTSYRLQSLKNQIVYGGNNQICLSVDGAIITADYTTGKKTGEIKTSDEDIICMAACGNMIVAGDKFKGTLKQYDISTGKLIRTYGEDAIAPIVWETATNAMGIVMDGLFDSPCGYFNCLQNGKVSAASFQHQANELMSVVGISADATITATYNQKAVQLYKAPIFDKPYISFSLDDKHVAALGITPDNKKLVVAYKNYIAVYDVLSGSLIKEISNSYSGEQPKKDEYPNHENGVCSFSDDSRYVAVKVDATAVFDLQRNSCSGELYQGEIEAIRISADGKKLYFVNGESYNQGVTWCEYNIENPAPPTQVNMNLSLKEVQVSDDAVQKINAAISPDLNLIAYVRNNEIWVYNRKEFVNTAFLKGHESYVRQVRWLANGILVSSGNDNTIRFWDSKKGIEIAKLVMFTNGSWVIVTPNGQFDASEDAMKKLYYVQGIETIPLDNLYETFYTPNLLARILQNDALPVPDVDVNKLAAPPKVKMTFDVARNLVVSDDVAKLDWTNEAISVKVNAESIESPIDEIRLYLNGKLVDNASRNLVAEDDNVKSLSKTFTIKLAPGTNNFKAIALNKQRTESQPDETDVNYIPAKNIPVPAVDDITLHLVIIGINNYKNPKYNLNYAKADATSFKEEMEQGNGTVFAKTKLYFITDAEAMKASIENTFNMVIKEAKPQDLFIFYYAGHGVMSDAGDKKDFYIVPYDVTQLYGADDALAQKGISAKELQEFSKNIPAQKQLFILDACQSAGMIDAIAMRGAAEEKAIAQLARSTGSHWLTASGSEQFASEFSQLGHGVFTYCLLQGLRGGAANGDKQVTVNELKAYLEIQVPELSQKYKGSPQYPASYGFGNDFPVEVLK